MAPRLPMPNYVRGVSAAGVLALRSAATGFAEWQLEAPIDTSLADAEALASEYLAKLKYPEHIFDALPEDAQDRVAVAVGCPTRETWQPAEPVPEGTPLHRMPSWETDVYAVLFERRRAPPPAARKEEPRTVSHVGDWPELASVDAWRKTEGREAIATALADALGADWKAGKAAGELGLPCVRSTKLGLSLVAVPGGSFAMGLSPEEKKDLDRRTKRLGPEARLHVRELAKMARPVHTVNVRPFLCASMPLRAPHTKKLRFEGDAANAHEVVRVDSETAAAVVAKARLRLLRESEWEWVARAAGKRAWLFDEDAPEPWVEATLASKLEDLSHPLGVVGLGWGEWIDDGFHPTYRGAPESSTSWDPKERPEVVRGGALALWPWQLGAEVVLCHVAARDRGDETARHAVRLATDLPERKSARGGKRKT